MADRDMKVASRIFLGKFGQKPPVGVVIPKLRHLPFPLIRASTPTKSGGKPPHSKKAARR